MRDKGIYYPIYEFKDKRSKYDRIVDAFSGPASNGVFYAHQSHDEFIQQFIEYPDVNHDDILDSVSMATISLPMFGVGEAADLKLAVSNSDIATAGSPRRFNYHYSAP